MTNPTEAQTSHLSGLPVELRDKVFIETVPANRVGPVIATTMDWFTDYADILQVSEHTRRKAEKIYYSTNHFSCVVVDGDCHNVYDWPQCLPWLLGAEKD